MAPLTPDLRRLLERAVVRARRVAEDGARAALAALAVSQPEAHKGTPQGERDLRNRLRAHARQLGDARDERSGTQEINRLAHEVAYEHWHRMLFARFLAENGLLLHPEHGVQVTLEECRELARDEAADPWELASRYAQTMLPRIFRPDDPALAVALAPEHQGALERLLADLPTQVFTSDDGLGWVYQFWQKERKDEVNRSGKKIGADELPAVTQLFTEHYMVLFLLHNTLGAWRAGKILAARPELARTATSEAELRAAMALPGYTFDYLRFVRETPEGPWRPAAGTYEGWPRRAAQIRALDPCCGSGHFLTATLDLLYRLRMDEEGLEAHAAVEAVLRDNLFGLELDPRCTQIAAFSLALCAWRTTGGWRPLPPLHVACSGLSVGGTRETWLSVARSNTRLRAGMERLYDLFQQAPVLGSLIDPRREASGDLFAAGFEELEPLISEALAASRTPDAIEAGSAAQDMATAASLLANAYTLVITNVPYLGLRRQSEMLQQFLLRVYPSSRHDLANAFQERCLELCEVGGTCAAVLPHNWLFASSFRALRAAMLKGLTLTALGRLGEGAFASAEAAGALVALVAMTRALPEGHSLYVGVDASAAKEVDAKGAALREAPAVVISQRMHAESPGHVIADIGAQDHPAICKTARCLAGIQNGDSERFQRSFWEVKSGTEVWTYQQGSPSGTRLYDGMSMVIDYDMQEGHLRAPRAWRRKSLHDSDQRGKPLWGRQGVLVSRMRSLPVTLYAGYPYDQSCAAIVPEDPASLPALWEYCSSEEYRKAVRALDQKINVTSATLGRVAFDYERWRRVAAERFPNGLPEPSSDDPTQWIFHGHPAHSTHPLQVAVARLSGYRWPAEDDGAIRLSAEARLLVEEARALGRHVDADGIVPLSTVRGEAPAADRVREMLRDAYGTAWTAAKERELIAATGSAETTLDGWLRNDFFSQHCALFHERPFVWHVWDGRKADGFGVLVNYHRLAEGQGRGKKALESIIYGYLGEWVSRQEAGRRAGEAGADARIESATELKGELERILLGEKPYDVFVRWKPLHRQAIGWEPDVDDGVRLNIRPFLAAELSRGGRVGAGVLRAKPNVKWTKDRGAEPEAGRPRSDFPWFWRGDEFTGERVNDVHLTLDEKRAARAAHERAAAKERR